MDTPKPGLLVVTDLDGTLLDDTYDLASAARAMDRFSGNHSQVLPASSKTLQELDELNQLRATPAPVIFENGAGVAYPTASQEQPLPYRVEGQGPNYGEICALLDSLRSSLNLKFEGFHDLSAAQVAGHTGLSVTAALLAKQRLYSEPIRWLESDAQAPKQQMVLREQLQKHSLQLIPGGRFLHVMPLANKGDAAASVAASFDAQQSAPWLHMACGDSENDLPLLRWADAMVLFPKRNGEYLSLRSNHCVLAPAAGSNDWIESVEHLIKTLKPTQLGQFV